MGKILTKYRKELVHLVAELWCKKKKKRTVDISLKTLIQIPTLP